MENNPRSDGRLISDADEKVEEEGIPKNAEEEAPTAEADDPGASADDGPPVGSENDIGVGDNLLPHHHPVALYPIMMAASPPLIAVEPGIALSFYEAQMRDHAAAYANAAAGAAWAAAQVARNASLYARNHGVPESSLPQLPEHCYQQYQQEPSHHHHHHHDESSELHQYEEPGRKRRQHRMPLDRDVASSPEPATPPRGHVRRRRRLRSDSSSSGSSYVRYTKNSKKKRTDESLLGKTGVSALFEWCGKRHKTPLFQVQKMGEDYFECAVALDDQECGRGRGSNKVACKQEAARQALQNLVPGVLFDSETGMLTSLPASLNVNDHLAPNLAKSLVFENKQKRALETSTSEDSESMYYASRGASICSQLLHTMTQIDQKRIPEAPVFTYQVSNTGRGGVRGSFSCNGRLKVLSFAVARKEEDDDDYYDDESAPPRVEKILEATGVAGTKREARHVASAKLLAKLFPECSNLAEVKAAAEAARERYARNKALKVAAQQQTPRHDASVSSLDSDTHYYIFALAHPDDPPLPRRLEEELFGIIRNEIFDDTDDDLVSSVNAVALSERPLSRHKQMDLAVETALQNLNDEEGRADELTDVGRTVLRRAEPDDLVFIKKLLMEKETRASSPTSSLPETFHSVVVEGDSETKPFGSDLLAHLWNTNCIVLLLCRSIALYDDPPLGCAVLTCGFSVSHGRVLRLAEIASEPHLPPERFLECLQQFANAMQCRFEPALSSTNEGRQLLLSTRDLTTIVQSHVALDTKPRAETSATVRRRPALTSVREESDEQHSDDESSVERRKRTPNNNKPSNKRSRFQ